MTPRRSLLLLLMCLILPIAAPTVATASTVVELSFDELTKASDAIIVGHVKSVTPEVRNNRVFSTIEITVSETLKGQVDDTVTLVQIGGRTEQLETRAHGMPTFTAGEHLLLFLEKPASVSHYVVTGLAQGKKLLTEHDGKLQLRETNTPLHRLRPIREVTSANSNKPPAASPATLDAARARIQNLTQNPP